MQKEYFVVKREGKYQNIKMDTHMQSDEFSTSFLIKDFDEAYALAKIVKGHVYELTIIEEKLI